MKTIALAFTLVIAAAGEAAADFVCRIGRAGDKDHPGVRLTVYKVG